MNARVNRREFLRHSAIVAIGIAAVACKAPEPTQPTAAPAAATTAPKAAATAVPAAQFKEAPMLAELVKAGKLPPLADRLPKNPKVFDSFLPQYMKMEVGKYSDKIRLLSSGKQYDQYMHIGCYNSLVHSPSHEGDPITSNICEYEVSNENKTFTFKLRQGLKWSDGKPVTTKDVQFVFEDIYGNTELSPRGMPAWLRTGNTATGEPAKLEIVDDTTFKLTFGAPYGSFPVNLGITGWRHHDGVLLPRHFMEQYHKKYADPAKLDAAIKENKFETWVQLFGFMNTANMGGHLTVRSIPMPKLTPWVIKESSDQRMLLERNPYYWKVDSAGNQLPYHDRVEIETVLDGQVMSLRQMAGEADAGALTIGGTASQIPLYKENETKGNYKTQFGRNHNVECDVWFNLTYKDENWRKVVRDVRFRKAMSLAVNRKELIDAVWFGFGDLPVAQDATYDPEAAKKLLDEMGLNKKDSEGFRLGPDGKTFSLLLETEDGTTISTHPKAAPLYAEFFNRVGIKTTFKAITNALLGQRNAANEIQAGCYFDTSELWFYVSHLQGYWAPLWNLWNTTGGKEGEEPPAEVKAYYDAMAKVMTLAPAEAKKLHNEQYKAIGQNYWMILPASNLQVVYFVSSKWGNTAMDSKALCNSIWRGGETFYVK